MSNALTTSNLPQHLQVLMGNTALQSINQDAVKGIGIGAWPRISIKGSRFRLQDPQGQEVVVPDYYLDVVIVAVNPHGMSKIFYGGAYDPNSDGTAPDCYSDNGVAPSVRASKPQCGTCAACPNNVWGSKITPNGAQVKACADIKKLAVLLANNTSGAVFELRVPAASLTNFGAYIRGLDSAGIPAASIITRLQFDTSADYPKLLFGTPIVQEGQSPYITPEMLADVMEVLGTDEVKQCTGENDKPIDTSKVGVAATTLIASIPANLPHASGHPGQPVYGNPRSPLETLPPPPVGPQRPPHVSGPPLPQGQVGPTPPPNPNFPHSTGVPPQPVAPAKRTRKSRTDAVTPTPAMSGPPAYAPTSPPTQAAQQPELPNFLRRGAAVGSQQLPPQSARDAASPVSVPVTDARMDDMLAQAMRT